MVTIQRLDGLPIIFAEGMVTGHIAVGMFENTTGHHGIRVAADCLGDIAGARCAGDAADVSICEIEGVSQLMHYGVNSVEELRGDWHEFQGTRMLKNKNFSLGSGGEGPGGTARKDNFDCWFYPLHILFVVKMEPQFACRWAQRHLVKDECINNGFVGDFV